MRIAVSGSHATGKSTLVADLQSRLEGYVIVEEPYHAVVGEGHVLGHPPSVDDFLLLVDRAIDDLQRQESGYVLFDRSPADYLAYLSALDSASISAAHVESTRAALSTLDLVVLVSVERPDRIAGVEMPRLRREVNRVLTEMFIDDSWDFNMPVVEVHGTPVERVGQVMARISTITSAA